LRFFADHCVPESACKLLETRGHTVIRLRDVLPTDTPDPIVAKAAQDNDAILLTHDGDFRTIAPRIPVGQKQRFRKLSKIHLAVDHVKSEKRLAAAISLVEFEWQAAQARSDKRMHIVVQPEVIKTHR
jgi:predicted nuclease of predicted toxin-antitoxin system